MEMEDRDEEDTEGLDLNGTMKGMEEGERWEDQDVREVSILLDIPVVNMENADQGRMVSIDIIHNGTLDDRVSVASNDSTIDCSAPIIAPATPIHWSWGQHWRCGTLGVGFELDLADSRRLEHCA